MQYNNIHQDFIHTSALTVINEAINACSGIGFGMETYPLKEYLFQNLFLRLTGFQEQKLKCICWTLATYDFDYRRILLKDDDRLGECSTFDSKTRIYVRLLEIIGRLKNHPFKIDDILDHAKIRRFTEDSIVTIFQKTPFEVWASGEFAEFKKNKGLFKESHFCTDLTTLLQSSLQEVYIELYNHRNRCAHNTLSYQDNLPSFTTFKNGKFYGNYFVWYALLLLLDKVFIELFSEFERYLVRT